MATKIKELNTVELQNIAKAMEISMEYKGLITIGKLWAKKSKKGVPFLSGVIGNSVNVMVYPQYNSENEIEYYSFSISGRARDSKSITVGKMKFRKDKNSSWFEGNFADNLCIFKKNENAEAGQPAYFIQLGSEHIEDSNIISPDEFEGLLG